MGFHTMLWLLALISAVGAACFYAGWRASAAYLNAAKAVSEAASVTASQAASYGVALDRTTAAVSSLQASAVRHAEAQDGRYKDVADVLKLLFDGLARSGIAKAPSRAPARQVGEPPAPE